jgi:hypothetical protein
MKCRKFKAEMLLMVIVQKKLVKVDSAEGIGTSITIKIPLTLAIIDGMNVREGGCYDNNY